MSRTSPVHTDPRMLRPIIEALIFASEEPLAPRLLVRLLAGEKDDPKANAQEEAERDSGADDGTAEAAHGTGGKSGDRDDDEETTFPDEALSGDESTAPIRIGTAEESVEGSAEGAVASARESVESPGEQSVVAPAEDAGGDAATKWGDSETPSAPEAALEEQREQVGDGWLEQEIGVEPGADELASATESARDLAEAYAHLGRTHSARLVIDEPVVAIDQRLVRRLIEDLNAQYEETGRAFRIVEVAGGFQFATIREYGEYVALLSKEKLRRRLSPAALETLAIIAFRQPISKPEIEAIRGVNSDQVLLSLLEKNLVSITGRSESVGRPLLYGTTEDFLRIFGLNSLNDLPKLREIEELMEENAYSAERIEVVSVPESSDAEQIEAAVGAAGHAEGDAAATQDQAVTEMRVEDRGMRVEVEGEDSADHDQAVTAMSGSGDRDTGEAHEAETAGVWQRDETAADAAPESNESDLDARADDAADDETDDLFDDMVEAEELDIEALDAAALGSGEVDVRGLDELGADSEDAEDNDATVGLPDEMRDFDDIMTGAGTPGLTDDTVAIALDEIAAIEESEILHGDETGDQESIDDDRAE